MTTLDALTTAEVAALLGLTRQAVVARVQRGVLHPIHKSPARNGGFLFDRAEIEQAAALERVEVRR